ncbi:MAG: hypothetical protein AAGF57_01740 [Pseudomonadota bacterium]
MERTVAVLLGLLAIVYLFSGLALLFFSKTMFDSLPVYYGVFNGHFVKDAGLAFMSSGILLFIAVLRAEQRLLFSFSASLFVVLHGLLHIQMLVTGMVPSTYITYELLQIILPAALLLLLVCVLYARQRR